MSEDTESIATMLGASFHAVVVSLSLPSPTAVAMAGTGARAGIPWSFAALVFTSKRARDLTAARAQRNGANRPAAVGEEKGAVQARASRRRRRGASYSCALADRNSRPSPSPIVPDRAFSRAPRSP